ncbi:hypothetical protein MSG28_012567 [Choristoneura fumiferana]|uniref:Uncharacterized protein n=1 Tax=Choristoneura fumiferana TaxID=7141 RepID=A0ACC0JH60_CHOFU|nr:hypothetical protein MSG28_012567 [Choristoneura fumiferana]
MCSNGKRYFRMISTPYSTLEKIPETIEPLKMTETVLEPGKVIKPVISHEEVKLLAERLYGISVLELTELNGYDDKNYKIIEDPNMKNPLITHHSPHGYVLKIMNSMDSQNKGIVEAQNEIMNLLNTRNVTCPKPVRNVYGHFYSVETLSGKQHAVRLLEFVPGALLKDVPRSEALMYQLGEFVANLDNKLQVPNWRWDVVPTPSCYISKTTSKGSRGVACCQQLHTTLASSACFVASRPGQLLVKICWGLVLQHSKEEAGKICAADLLGEARCELEHHVLCKTYASTTRTCALRSRGMPECETRKYGRPPLLPPP